MTNTNPWVNLTSDSMRRIDADLSHDFFWIMSETGKYGLCISINSNYKPQAIPKLNGIEIIINESERNGVTNLYLLLNNNSDWQLFLSLCTDLVKTGRSESSQVDLPGQIVRRLLKWQKFLSHNNSNSMSEQTQMGLISELLCLKDIVLPSFSSGTGLLSWVGSEFDKQDFSLPECFIEVKSYITSKGGVVRISSSQQLNNNVKPLYLVAYGLSKVEKGINLPELVESLLSSAHMSGANAELFETKLAAYGYMHGITSEPFFHYTTDIVRSFSVTGSFPKITTDMIQPQIVSVDYSINLDLCYAFQTALAEIINDKL